MSPRLAISAIVMAALLALAGCGGGGDDESTAQKPATTETTPTLTKAELISQGDAICAEVNAAVGSVGGSGAEVPDQITQASSLYTGMVERLEGLGEPTEKAGYADFIAAAEGLAQVEGEVKVAAESSDTAALGEAATKAAPALEEFESAAAAYGFQKCSEGPSAPTVAGAETGATEEGEEGGIAPEASEEPEVAPEEVAPEAGGEEAAPEGGGTGPAGGGGATEGGGSSSGGIGAE
jgi:hypothetical protein